ncbi:MAG: mechanosensitive ion channel [Calditrichaeota bacterium]|nr:mechanosensitive ion channel [Calditrichota bacterium]MCB9369309.1 mechanosensitive ion channel [Calditrichota bacterium]
MNTEKHIATLTGLTPEEQSKIILTLIVLLGLIVLRWLIVRVLHRQSSDARNIYVGRKIVTNSAVVLGVLVIGRIWFEGFQSLATFAGLLTAGLAIALKDLLVNFVGWMFIIWRKPFTIGDRMQIGEVSGDVIDMRLFQFSLLEIGNWVAADQHTGRVVHIPNGKIFTDAQSIYTGAFNYIWNEIAILVTFESDWRKAKEILELLCRKHGADKAESARQAFRDAADKYLISVADAQPRVYTKVEDSGVLLTIRYLCTPHERRMSEEAIWEDVLIEFAKHDNIDFAYPTTRYYDNRGEGKPGARAQ